MEMTSDEDKAMFSRYHNRRNFLRRRSRSAMRLSELEPKDDYDMFLAQAGIRKLSNAGEFGGSLPTFQQTQFCHTRSRLQRDNSIGDCKLCGGAALGSKLISRIRNLLVEDESSQSEGPKKGLSRVHSAPPSRSASMKRQRLQKGSHNNTSIRPRTSSFPNRKNLQRPNTLELGTGPKDSTECLDGWYKVRQFESTPHGFRNRGDSFRSSSRRSLGSCASSSAQGSANSITSLTLNRTFKVHVLGAASVGKTTLVRQFKTSENMAALESHTDLRDRNSVSVCLDDEEARLVVQDYDTIQMTECCCVDAYVILFGIEDKTSFHHAVDLLFDLRMTLKRKCAIILVANKIDLVRLRQVSDKEGKAVAETYECKYAEVSGLLNLQVDELLAGIVRQIQLRQVSQRQMGSLWRLAHEPSRSPREVLTRLFKKRQYLSKSCDNLLV